MSVQLGRWNMDGQAVDPCYLQKAKEMLVPYGPDGEGVYIKDTVGILYRAFHTTKESRKESQPLVTPSGTVICWDGRLDNRSELIGGLKDLLTAGSTDVEIVGVAYQLWGTECFAKLIGDWALSIWNPSSRSLLLAKDFVGTRHLYYSIEKDQVTWSSILDPLVLLAEKSFALEEEYIAGWLSFFPATHLDSICRNPRGSTVLLCTIGARTKDNPQVLGFRSVEENPLPDRRRIRGALPPGFQRIC